MGTIWACVSGKGGVGKSTVALCAAVELGRRGKTVALVDADAGVRNLDMMLGVENRIVFDLLDVMEETATLKQATIEMKQYAGVSLISAAQTQEQDAFPEGAFESILKKLRKQYDYVIVDCPTGIGSIVRSALACCDEAILVTTPDNVAIRDADHMAGILSRIGRAHPCLIVNRVPMHLRTSGEVYDGKTISQTLDASFLGEVPEDEAVYRCMLRQTPPTESEGAASDALKQCIAVMLGECKAKLLEVPAHNHTPHGFFARIFRAKGIEE